MQSPRELGSVTRKRTRSKLSPDPLEFKKRKHYIYESDWLTEDQLCIFHSKQEVSDEGYQSIVLAKVTTLHHNGNGKEILHTPGKKNMCE